MRLRLIVIDDIAPRGCVHYICNSETQLFSQFINFRASDQRNVLRINKKHIFIMRFF